MNKIETIAYLRSEEAATACERGRSGETLHYQKLLRGVARVLEESSLTDEHEFEVQIAFSLEMYFVKEGGKKIGLIQMILDTFKGRPCDCETNCGRCQWLFSEKLKVLEELLG